MTQETDLSKSRSKSRSDIFIDKNTLRILRQRSDVMGALLVTHCWAVILGAMGLYALLPNPLTFILAVMLIGARQLGLGILMHEAAHNALFKTPKFNNLMSDIFCAWPVMANTKIYRNYHLKHHAFAQQKDDPDLILSKPFPVTKTSLRRKLGRDMMGQTAFRQRMAQISISFGSAQMPILSRLKIGAVTLAPYILTNLAVFLLCMWLFHWSYYFMFWLLPFATSYMLVLRIRNIAEHAIVSNDKNPLRNTRSTMAGFLERVFIAPYWVNYHIEHHVLMFVPCYRLPKLHRWLMAQGYGSEMEIASGYIEVLRLASSRPEQDNRPDKNQHERKSRVSGHLAQGFQKT